MWLAGPTCSRSECRRRKRDGKTRADDWLLQLVARGEPAGYGAWCPGPERGADVGRWAGEVMTCLMPEPKETLDTDGG
jgi:hypothetical protein